MWLIANSIVAVVLVGLLVALFQKRRTHSTNIHGLPYPPGPKPLPLVGNMFDLAREEEAATYLKFTHKYGDLFFLTVLGKNILFVNSNRSANELFEKRSVNFSDRTHSPMINDLMGWDWSFGHMRYGETWKMYRRLFHRQFQPSAIPMYSHVQIEKTNELLRYLLDSPKDLVAHFRHNAASTIVGVIYGIPVAPQDDHYVEIAEKALDGMGKASNPGAFLVELIPQLKYVPAWFPGAGFQRKAREWREAVMHMRDDPFNVVLEAQKQGTSKPCFVSNALADLDAENDTLDNMSTVRDCAGLAYAAGAESTVSTLTSFILAIVTHPEALKKAHEEIDRVIGRERFPTFGDSPQLPYVTAIFKEVFRWGPVAPLGLPHMSTNDEEYNGYFIPANTIVIGNTWAILRDPETYPDPDSFNPDRFITKEDDRFLTPGNPLTSAFGYGRRICPGRFFAEAHVWVLMARILSVFNIGPGLDENGKPHKVVPQFTSGLIRHPLPFKFEITPRDAQARALIEQTMDHVN